jgi:hypothetical protein
VFTARYAMSPYIEQIRVVFKGLISGAAKVLTIPKMLRKFQAFIFIF